jgi:hypothetical protein
MNVLRKILGENAGEDGFLRRLGAGGGEIGGFSRIYPISLPQ